MVSTTTAPTSTTRSGIFLFGSAAVLGLLIAQTPTCVANTNDDCNAGEQPLAFTLFLDEDSLTENGWSLECEEEGLVWHVPPGTLQTTNPAGLGYVHSDGGDFTSSFVTEQTCLPEDFTCHFTLEDLHGDGLLFPGYFYLTLGATTIAVLEEGEEFFEKVFCIGPDCSSTPGVEPPQEIAEDCDDLYLYFQADTAPDESSITITCDDEIVFAKSDFLTQFESIEVEQCLPTTTSCCTLTVSDTGKNGWEPVPTGNMFVEWANDVVFLYDDSNAFEFETHSVDFGLNCPAAPLNQQEDDPDAETATADIDDGMTEQLDSNENEGEQAIESIEPIDDESEQGTDSLDDKNSVEQQVTMQDQSSSMPVGVTVAIIVLSTLAAIGLLVWIVMRRRCNAPSMTNSSSSHPRESQSPVKDDVEMESTSGSSRGTDPDDEEDL